MRRYLALKRAQLREGGVLLIRDVIGPEEGDARQFALFSREDGLTPEPEAACGVPVAQLSTLGRWYRFAREFRGAGCAYEQVERDGKAFIVAARNEITEFLSKKDYVDNWASELHESFTHWPFSRWRAELSAAGFDLDISRSKAYRNPWIVDTHYRPTTALFRERDGHLIPDDYPPTNVVLVAHPAPS